MSGDRPLQTRKDTLCIAVHSPSEGMSRQGDATVRRGRICECLAMRLVLKQFDENNLRTVDLIHDPQPTGVAVHVLYSCCSRQRRCACPCDLAIERFQINEGSS
jgi:hypothetical protein